MTTRRNILSLVFFFLTQGQGACTYLSECFTIQHGAQREKLVFKVDEQLGNKEIFLSEDAFLEKSPEKATYYMKYTLSKCGKLQMGHRHLDTTKVHTLHYGNNTLSYLPEEEGEHAVVMRIFTLNNAGNQDHEVTKTFNFHVRHDHKYVMKAHLYNPVANEHGRYALHIRIDANVTSPEEGWRLHSWRLQGITGVLNKGGQNGQTKKPCRRKGAWLISDQMGIK